MMYLSISLIILAFVWLLFETDNLTVRLPCGRAKTETQILLLTAAVDEAILLLPASTFKATEFQPCDLDQPEDFEVKTILNVGAKIL